VTITENGMSRGPVTPYSEQLSTYAAQASFSAIPEHVVERTKMVIFDELGCEVIGRLLPPGRIVAKYVRSQGGVSEARVIGETTMLPAALAALANGTAGHADEYDSPHSTPDFRGTGHPACIIVPAAVATAESRSATGRELVNAVCVGYDVGSRVISATGGLGPLRDGHGVYAGSLHGFGAAAASCRLMGLDAERHLYAAGIVSGQTLSLSAFFGERRHMTKGLVHGQGAWAGVTAATLAGMGFESSDDVFGDRYGVLDTWAAEGRESELVKDLGEDFAITGVNFKFYSAGYPIHAPVEAALELLARHDLNVDDIEHVAVHMPSFAASVVDNREMPSITLQDMLAVAMVAGRLGVAEAHSATLLLDRRVRRLRDLITVVRDADFDERQPHGRGARVVITTGGNVVSYEVEHPKGHRFRTPAPGWAEMREKWEPELVPFIGSARFDDFYSACTSLEAVDTITDITGLLAVG
jgi:2-methylcitrate dehydratase PrpD